MSKSGYRLGRIAGYFAAATIVVLLLGCLGFVLPLQLGFYLLLGWIPYLNRVLSSATVDWGGVALGAIAFTLFAGGLHWFLSWFYAVTHPGDSAAFWRVRWTASVVTIVMLMFVAGIAKVGITHQTVWLLTSREPLLGSGSEAARRMQSGNNLKQIALGLQNYHDDFLSFPPGATATAEGHVLHGWQTNILPYVEQKRLWERIDKSNAWNDPVNKDEFATVVFCYTLPHRSAPPHDSRGYALSHYAANVHVLGGTQTRGMADITDGTSKTIIAGEAKGNFKPWGNPTNWRDPLRGLNQSPDGFGGPWKNGTLMVFADGHVQRIQDNIDKDVLKALSTLAGGERVPEDY